MVLLTPHAEICYRAHMKTAQLTALAQLFIVAVAGALIAFILSLLGQLAGLTSVNICVAALFYLFLWLLTGAAAGYVLTKAGNISAAGYLLGGGFAGLLSGAASITTLMLSTDSSLASDLAMQTGLEIAVSGGFFGLLCCLPVSLLAAGVAALASLLLRSLVRK